MLVCTTLPSEITHNSFGPRRKIRPRTVRFSSLTQLNAPRVHVPGSLIRLPTTLHSRLDVLPSSQYRPHIMASKLSLSPFDVPSATLAHFNRVAGSTSGQDKIFMIYACEPHVPKSRIKTSLNPFARNRCRSCRDCCFEVPEIGEQDEARSR